ncbi:MAG: histidine kinase dimerization/phospho-acceptor domain-containing protein [Longimicrobiales bacterium]
MPHIARHLEPVELEAQRFELASRLADDLSHEIKNPLHAIVINLELIRRRIATQDGEAALTRLGVVEGELHRIHRLIDSLLRVMRPARPRGSVDLGAVLEDLLPVLESEAKVGRAKLRHASPDDVALIDADVRAVGHAVLQIMLLALDGLGGVPGTLELELRRADRGPEIRLRSSPADAEADATPDGSASIASAPDASGADAIRRSAERLERAHAFAAAAHGELAIEENSGGERAYTLRLRASADT